MGKPESVIQILSNVSSLLDTKKKERIKAREKFHYSLTDKQKELLNNYQNINYSVKVLEGMHKAAIDISTNY